jgi:hypothetical protein
MSLTVKMLAMASPKTAAVRQFDRNPAYLLQKRHF